MKRIETRVIIKVQTIVDGTVYQSTHTIDGIPSFKNKIEEYGAEKLNNDIMRGFIRAYSSVENRAKARWRQLGIRGPARPPSDVGGDGERPTQV